LEQEVLARAVWRTHFGRGYGSVVRLRNDWPQQSSDRANLPC